MKYLLSLFVVVLFSTFAISQITRPGGGGAAGASLTTVTNITLTTTNTGREFFSANSFVVGAIDPATGVTVSYPTNSTSRAVMRFAAAGNTRASWIWAPPPDASGDFSFRVYAGSGVSGGGSVVWNVNARALAQAGSIDVGFTTSIKHTNTVSGTGGYRLQAMPPYTAAGFGPFAPESWTNNVPGQILLFRLGRIGDDPVDDAGALDVWGVEVIYGKKTTLAN